MPTKRRFTSEYKQRILRQLDELRISGDRGAVGGFLRREGLSRPSVYRWSLERDKAEREASQRAVEPKKRGRPSANDPVAEENARLRKENERLQKELRKAEIIIDVQKKLAALLGMEVPAVSDPEKDETP
jgi:transposase-like protein